MRRHFTKRQLIKYEFKLVSAGRAERIAEHLAQCEQCRERLEELRRKFSALELVREQAEIGEGLVLRVVQGTAEPARQRVVSPGAPAWVGAAAAMVVIGSLILVSYMKRGQPARPTERPGKAALITEGGPLVAAAGTKGAAGGAGEQIPEQPPFAPASAIELVVLPRRESVQLTIYNSSVEEPRGYGGYGGYGSGGGYREPVAEQSQQERYGSEQARRVRRVRAERQADVDSQRARAEAARRAGADLTLVRERRNLTLKRGWNWLQFMWANTLIDPTSLHLEPLEQKDKIKVEQLVFPARLRELGRWLIRSEVSGQVPFEITYFTSGLTWRAFYMGTLSKDEMMMRLEGYVRVDNGSGEDYENAETQLVVGRVHLLDQIAELARRQYPYGSPIVPPVSEMSSELRLGRNGGYAGNGGGFGGNGDGVVVGGFFSFRPKEIVKEGLSEYFLYTIEGTETIPDKWAKRLLSFDVNDIKVKSLYKYDEERYGLETVRFVAFANDEEHNLGKTPIPDGSVKIYGLADGEGYLSYVGGTGVKYIPVNEEVELNLGAARLVKVEPTLMELRTENYVFDKSNNVTGWDEIRTWKIEVANTRILPIEIEITRGFGMAYWTLQMVDPASMAEDAVKYEKHDVSSARFKLAVRPRMKKTFGYMVTTYHGIRQEQISQ